MTSFPDRTGLSVHTTHKFVGGTSLIGSTSASQKLVQFPLHQLYIQESPCWWGCNSHTVSSCLSLAHNHWYMIPWFLPNWESAISGVTVLPQKISTIHSYVAIDRELWNDPRDTVFFVCPTTSSGLPFVLSAHFLGPWSAWSVVVLLGAMTSKVSNFTTLPTSLMIIVCYQNVSSAIVVKDYDHG